jgi:hypothetical protein
MRIEGIDCIGGSSRGLGRDLKERLRVPGTVLLPQGLQVMRVVIQMIRCISLRDVA